MADPTKSSAPSKSSAPWLKFVIAALFVGGLIAFFALGGQQYLSLERIQANRDALLDFTQRNYALMIIIALLVYIVSTALSVPGAIILSLLCGFLFGRWMGTLVIVIGASIGASLVFLAARYLFADAARAKMGGLAEKINQGFTKDAFNYLLFLRLVPAFPFWLVNLAPAFSNVSLRTYASATALGIVPGSFVFANLGQSLGSINSLSGLVQPSTLIAFALLGVISLVPVVMKKLRAGKA